MSEHKNVILISLDTVRADVAYSGQFPAIEKLREKGVTFLNTTSSAPLTPVSHATVFTGQQPQRHGIRHLFKEQLKRNTKTLAQIFKKAGYVTGAIVSCPGMNKWYGFGKGFDFYDDEIPRLADGSDPLETVDVKKRGTALKRAEVVIERALSWVDDKRPKSKPFFLFLHFFDAHWPYEAPQKFGGHNKYEEEVAYSDHYLGVFFDEMEKRGLLKDATIICFSDHGEDLDGLYENDKGGKKLGHPEECGHGCLLYEQTQQVVLIMKHDILPEHHTISDQVRLVDVAPTILELHGIKHPASTFDGISILPLIKGQSLNLIGYSETMYPEEQTVATGGKYANAKNKRSVRIANRHKVITDFNGDALEVYDLQSDPNELKNIV